MITFNSSVRVNRPPEAVFPYLVEPAKQALWLDVVMRPLTDGPFGVGTRQEITFGQRPMQARIGVEFTAYEPGARLAWAPFSGPIRWTGQYTLEPTPDGTLISQEGRLEFRGLWRLLEPIVGAEISRGEVKELERLKSVVERA